MIKIKVNLWIFAPKIKLNILVNQTKHLNFWTKKMEVCIVMQILKRTSSGKKTYGKAWFLELVVHGSSYRRGNPPSLVPQLYNTCPDPPCGFATHSKTSKPSWSTCSRSDLRYRPSGWRCFRCGGGRCPKRGWSRRERPKLSRRLWVNLTWWTGWHIRPGKRLGSNRKPLNLKIQNYLL